MALEVGEADTPFMMTSSSSMSALRGQGRGSGVSRASQGAQFAVGSQRLKISSLNGLLRYGERVSTTAQLADQVLPVDLAVSGESLLVAEAGLGDPEAPTTRTSFGDAKTFMPRGGVAVHGPNAMREAGVLGDARSPLALAAKESCVPMERAVDVVPLGQTVAVATGTVSAASDEAAPAPLVVIAVQVREPSELHLYWGGSFDAALGASPVAVELGGAPRLDTGNELFHRDAGGGIACASCPRTIQFAGW